MPALSGGSTYRTAQRQPIIDDDTSIRSSVGASVLWASPLGLLRGDFAYALTKRHTTRLQWFRFSAGTQF